MALDEAPPFWWEKPGWQAILLSPVAYFFGRVAARRMNADATGNVPVPVICVGNFIAGGAGKTPTVQLLVRHARKRKMQPGILSRGYGGAITTATLVRQDRHNSHDVGDEALLHAALAPTVVSPDRPAGANILVEHGCDVIIMDDGFQNPYLKKDYNLVVVDSKRGVGNGFTMPAGPMRVPLRQQMLHVDGLMIIGDHDGAERVLRRAARAAKPIFRSMVHVVGKTRIKGKKALAFAGTGDPTKFFETLKSNNVEVVESQTFGDHHVYTSDECEELIDKAEKSELTLMTTTKDAARLKGMGDAQQRLCDASEIITIELRPDDPGMLDRIFEKAVDRMRARKLRAP